MKHILKELQRIIGKEDVNVTIREQRSNEIKHFKFSNTKENEHQLSVEDTHRMHDGHWDWEQPTDNITF